MREETFEGGEEMRLLQIELVRLLDDVRKHGRRLLVIVEGRDTAGKGGAIFHFARYLNPKYTRVVALPAPSELERGQWYFQRYFRRLPNRGEIVFFDRSWYNRAVVEPVMGFCTQEQTDLFLRQVVEVERMLVEDGIALTKLWFSIDADEQRRRLDERRKDPLKRWKLSTVDALAQAKWDDFTRHKNAMYESTHRDLSPWIVVRGNDKAKARLESIRWLLSTHDYELKGETGVSLAPDPAIVRPWSDR